MHAYRQVIIKYFVPVSILLLLCMVHFYYLNRYGINVPFSDDYNEILNNMNMILDSRTFVESAGHLLYGSGYSKPITLRLISLLHISLFHEINFRYLVFTGNFFLLLTCIVLTVSTLKINKYLAVAIACFVFQPQYWEAIYQSTLSNSVFPCLFFSLASIYCITQQRTFYYVLSLILAVLAQLSFGNGFMVYPLLLTASVFQKNVKLFIVIFITMVLTTYLYMLGTTVSYADGQQMELLTKLKLWTLWLCEFLGSAVGYVFSSGYSRNPVSMKISIIIGFMLVIFYIFLIKKKYYARNLTYFLFFTFFLLTALLAAKLRYSVEAPGASRYQIQSALCILTTLIIIIDMYSACMNRYMVTALVIIFPMLFMLASYRTNMSTVLWHKSRLANGLWTWIDTGKGLTIWSGEAAAGRLLRQSINRNIYRSPSRQTLITETYK